jgi:RHS repeat-associated protein
VEFEVNNLTAANYTYDYNGQQVAATTGTQSIHYVYDLDGRLIAEHDGSTGSVLREYVWLDDRPLAFVVAAGAAAGTYFLHTGQIGEPLMLTNASGAVVWSVAIDPWGQATTLAPASVELDVRLVGQWLRGVSGLHQNWMRDYDPTLGRYVQADPMGLGDGTNLYTYVEGDPLNDQDPTGEFGLAGALIGAGLDLGLQLATNGGKIECVNWMQVGISGAVGAILPGAFARRFAVSAGRGGANAWKWANAGRRMRRSWQTGADTDLHHWAIPRRFERYGPAAQRIVNHPLNISPVLRTQHDSIHRAATSPLVAWHLGVPTWAKAGQVALPAGAILDALDPDCRCR